MKKDCMPRILKYLSRSFVAMVFVCFASACHHFGHEEVSAVSVSYRFDAKVIEKLPVYDSLAAAIIEKFSFFRQHINDKESTRSFRYMPSSTEKDVSTKLPTEVAGKIDRYFNQLGDGFIDGFDVFKDSTIKFHVRISSSNSAPVEIHEYLSYYPAGNFFRRELPARDTILNDHWQYWALFERGLF